MDVFIDQTEFNTTQVSLDGIINDARSHVDPSGRMIVEVRVDGRPLTDSDFDQLASQTDIDADEIQLLTANPYDLALSALSETTQSLNELETAHKSAADFLSADETQKALDIIQNILKTWQNATLSVQASAELLNISLDTLSVNDNPANRIIDSLKERLAQLREQLIASDFIGLADTLAYEMDETVTEWTQLIQSLSNQVQGAQN